VDPKWKKTHLIHLTFATTRNNPAMLPYINNEILVYNSPIFDIYVLSISPASTFSLLCASS
jgi:hypothetical protein